MKHYYKNFFFNRFFLSIVFFLLFLNNVFSQWTNINSPSQYRFWSIGFPSASIGYIGGVEGTYKSKDGGSTWSKIMYLPPKYNSTDSTYLEGINEQYLHFMSDSIGVIAGWNAWDNSEVIIKTIDGGDTWTVKQKGAFDTEFKAISFPSNSIGYVAGLKGRILKTTNAGDGVTTFEWTKKDTTTSNSIFIIEYDENGNVLNNDIYSSKKADFSRSARYGQYGILSKNKCGDIYYANTFYDIIIDSTHIFNQYNQIVITKYAPDRQCAKRNCIPNT